MNLFDELTARGLIHQVTEQEVPLQKALATPQVVYAGFDPSAPSLHVGNLVPLLGLVRFQRAGHRPVALAGGATGLIGDPSGKSEERNLLDDTVLEKNLAGIKAQMQRFLDFSGPSAATLVDNLDWTRNLTLLDFLRDVGKHFTVNAMLRKDSVKNRIEREGAGISFTEFSYMLLQAMDFLVLARDRGCTIQIGGSDQWGNITAGVELIRRVLGKHAYGVTFPLLMNTDGSKFGKTAKGAVFLDPAMTSPFAFRQFWYRTQDADLAARLKVFTFFGLDEIADLEKQVATAPAEVKRRLAQHMTTMVHGAAESERVEKAAEVLFKNADFREVPAEFLGDAFEGSPVHELPKAKLEGDGLPWLDLVAEAFAVSRGQAKRDIATDKSMSLNGQKWTDPALRVKRAELLHDTFLVLRKGKSNTVLVKAV